MMYRAWQTTLAPILITFSRNVVIVQWRTLFGSAVCRKKFLSLHARAKAICPFIPYILAATASTHIPHWLGDSVEVAGNKSMAPGREPPHRRHLPGRSQEYRFTWLEISVTLADTGSITCGPYKRCDEGWRLSGFRPFPLSVSSS